MSKLSKGQPKCLIKSSLYLTCAICLSFSLNALSAEKAPPSTLPMPAETESITSSSSTPEYVVIQPSDIIIFSSEIAASVAELYVKEGSHFKMGDTLLKLDCRVQQAELAKAQAQYNTALKAEESAIKLKSYGSISEMELIKAHADATIGKAEIDKLNAIIEKCTIKASFNGAVAQLMIHNKETVKPGDPLLKIINTENLEFEIQIPSSWLKWLKINYLFYVHVNETNKNVKVKVERIDPQIESISQTVKITGIIEEPDSTLLPGMSGQAIFPDNPALSNNKTKKTEHGQSR